METCPELFSRLPAWKFTLHLELLPLTPLAHACTWPHPIANQGQPVSHPLNKPTIVRLQEPAISLLCAHPLSDQCCPPPRFHAITVNPTLKPNPEPTIILLTLGFPSKSTLDSNPGPTPQPSCLQDHARGCVAPGPVSAGATLSARDTGTAARTRISSAAARPTLTTRMTSSIPRKIPMAP